MANVIDLGRRFGMGCCYAGSGIFEASALKNFAIDMYNRTSEMGARNPFESPYFDDALYGAVALGIALGVRFSSSITRYCGRCITGHRNSEEHH